MTSFPEAIPPTRGGNGAAPPGPGTGGRGTQFARGRPGGLFLQLNNADAAARLFSTLGVNPGNIRLEVLPNVQPVAIVEGTPQTDLAKRAFGAAALTPAAGEFTNLQIFNPGGSGLLVHVTGLLVMGTVNADTFQVNLLDAALTTLVANSRFSDRRVLGTPAAQIRSESNVTNLGAPTVGFVGNGAVNDTVPYPIDAFLLANQGIVVTSTTANTRVHASWRWEELPL